MTQAPLMWDWDVVGGAVEWNDDAALGDLVLASTLSTESAWLAAIVAGDRARVRAARATALDAPDRVSHWAVTYHIQAGADAPLLVRERGSVALDAGGVPFRAAGMLNLVEADAQRRASPRPELTAPQLHLFFDWLPHLAWSTDAEGWIDFYNRRWYEYTGTTFEEMEGWGWIRVHDPNDLTRITRVYRQAFSTGQPWEDEFRLRRASDGMMRWHLSRAMPVRDATGAIVRWFGTNTDVHDQKLAGVEYARLLARAERARAEAEGANQARDRFLAMVSHELRTPLNAISGWAQILRTGQVEPKMDAALAKIEANARLQAHVINDLLDVSRVIGGKLTVSREVLDLGTILEEAVETIRPALAKAGVEIVMRGQATGTTILGDRGRLLQVFGNLLTNALKFGGSGRRIEVEVAVDNAHASTTISDQGVGLDAEQISQLFGVFWQANTSSTRRHGGLGLGLAIARQLVELHGGQIEVRSSGVGTGAAFTVILPTTDPVEPVPAIHDDEGEPIRLCGTRVLAVDDEPSARDVLASALLSCGATVSTAASVSEALRALRGASFDVVISDIAMPELDGYELVARARELPGCEHLPMIALTAHAGDADRAKALRAGFDRHLAKPIDVRALARCVSECAQDVRRV